MGDGKAVDKKLTDLKSRLAVPGFQITWLLGQSSGFLSKFFQKKGIASSSLEEED